MVPQVTDLNTEPGYGWTMDLDLVLSIRPDSDVTVVPGSGAGHSDWHGPPQQHCPRTQTWIQVVAQTLGTGMTFMVSGTIVINTDPGCSRVIDLDVTMVPCGSASH